MTAPVAIKQNLPPWPQGIPKTTVRGRRAVLDITINEAGNVESVVVRESIVDWYDEALIKEAKGWSYKPASKDGRAGEVPQVDAGRRREVGSETRAAQL